MFTDVGFHLKSGFKKILCSQMLVFTLILVSRKFCVHQFFLYIMCSVKQYYAYIVYCFPVQSKQYEMETLDWRHKSLTAGILLQNTAISCLTRVVQLQSHTTMSSPGRHGKCPKFYPSRIVCFQILPESARITSILKSRQNSII